MMNRKKKVYVIFYDVKLLIKCLKSVGNYGSFFWNLFGFLKMLYYKIICRLVCIFIV